MGFAHYLVRGVEVFEGVVTLTGTVDSNAKKRAAQEAAHLIDGVLAGFTPGKKNGQSSDRVMLPASAKSGTISRVIHSFNSPITKAQRMLVETGSMTNERRKS
jgi:hypothetical protein